MDVEIDHVELQGAVEARGRAVQAEARIVDEPGDLRMCGQELRFKGVARGGARQVAGQDEGSGTALRGDLVGQRLQPVAPACDQRQIVSVARHEAGEFGADAIRGTGDERDLAHGRSCRTERLILPARRLPA